MNTLRLALGLVAIIVCVAGLSSCDPVNLSQGNSQPAALIYGVSIYVDRISSFSSPNLQAPILDVHSMTNLFGDQGWKTMERANSQATVTSLEADIASLAAESAPGRRILFYWSGHGLQGSYGGAPYNEYLALYGVLNQTTFAIQPEAMVSPERLAIMFKPLLDKGANLVFVMDSCYSGGFVGTGTYSTELPDNYDTSGKWGDSSTKESAFAQSLNSYFSSANTGSHPLTAAQVWVMSAAGRDEESWESEQAPFGHGIFTTFFLGAGAVGTSGLMNGDYNLDSHLTLQESYRYALEQVQATWNDEWSKSSQKANLQYADLQFKPHLSGNPLDILLF